MANFISSPTENRTAEGPVARPRDTVGDLLRRTRQEQNIAVEQVAGTLRIRAAYITAIEQGRYDRLPGSVYALGFVRTYANALGLDGEEAVRRFKLESAGLEQRRDLAFPMPLTSRSMPGGRVVLVAFVLAVCSYAIWHYVSTSDLDRPERVASVPTELLPPPPPAPTPAPAPAAAPAAPASAAATSAPAAASATTAPGATPAAAQSATQAASTQTASSAPNPPAVAASPLPPPTSAASPPSAPTAGAQPGAALVAPPAAALSSQTASLTPPAPAAADAGGAPTDTGAPAPQLPPGAAAVPAPISAPSLPPGAAAVPVPASPLPPGAASVPASATSAAEQTAAATPATQPAPTAPRVFGAIDGPSHITLVAKQDCWIQVRDANDPTAPLVAQRTLHAGDSYRVPDRGGLVLRTGNATGLQVMVDNRAAPALGGTVREVTLDPAKLMAGNAVE